MKTLRLLAAAAAVTASCVSSPGQQIATPAQLIQAMHDRYAPTWYRTLEFEQKSTTIHPDGTQDAVNWHEEMKVPGKLRIDIAPKGSGDGILFANDVQYAFKGGKLEHSTPRIHPLLLLGFDVYSIPVETTLDKLKRLGFDLSVLHEEDWEGHPVYVVGARQGDLHSPQFWIEKERLLFVRSIQPNPRAPGTLGDTRFEDYVESGGGWVAKRVEFRSNDKLTFTEDYSEIRSNIPVEDAVFDPDQFASTQPK